MHSLGGVRVVVVTLAAVSVVAGCGSSTHDHSAVVGSQGLRAAEQALKLWNGFPATVSPRPVLTVGDGSVLPPSGGFITGNAKVAFLEGRFALKAALPKAPSKINGREIMSAKQALRLLSVQGAKGPPNTARLMVGSVRLTSAVFETDRGPQKLPAWSFLLLGLERPVYVLALTGASAFTAPATRHLASSVSPYEDDRATISADGRVVRLSFTGAHAGHQPCDASYSAKTASDTHAIAFWLVAHPVRSKAPTACTAVGYTRTVAIHLVHPLGARVLVDAASAGPVLVTTRQRRAAGRAL
jgi:hypothetical protein